jgi:hypothetical protein
MPADLNTRSVNLKKLRNNEQVRGLFSTWEIEAFCDVVSMLNKYKLSFFYALSEVTGKMEWQIKQYDFYTLADLIALVNMGGQSYISTKEPSPFRRLLLTSGANINEFTYMLSCLGINDSNCHVNNYENTISFNRESMRRLFSFLFNVETKYQEDLLY